MRTKITAGREHASWYHNQNIIQVRFIYSQDELVQMPSAMTTQYHRACTEPARLTPELITQLQSLFFEKYGLRPSGTYWICPVYNTKLPPAKRTTTAPALLYTRLEHLFLNDDLRRTFPPLHQQPVELIPDNVNAATKTTLQYYYQNHGDDRFREQDLVGCVKGSNFVPDGIAAIRSTTIAGPITFQIVEVQEIGSSKCEQLRTIEEALTERGGNGRKVVRDLPTEAAGVHVEENEVAGGPQAPSSSTTNGVQFHTLTGTKPGWIRTSIVGKVLCKVLLQDPLGRCYWALESKPINELEVGIKLGSKVTLTNFTALRGVIMLKPTSVVIHGGAIDEWNIDFIPKLISKLKREMGLQDDEPNRPRSPMPALSGGINDPEIIEDDHDYDDDDDDYNNYFDDDDLDDVDFEVL
ncbi:hypothetical protein V1509DRAFT_667100 [Lipomyces kononenkoae]